MNYQQSLHSQFEHEYDEEDEIDKYIRQSAGKGKTTKVSPPKPYKTMLYIRKADITSFHAAFQRTDSKKLDGTAIYSTNGEIYISTLPCKDFLNLYNGIQKETT